MILPRLYAILDAVLFPDTNALLIAADELAAAGVTLIQYRNKSGNARLMLEQSRELKKRFADTHSSQKLREVGHPVPEKRLETTTDGDAPCLADFARHGYDVRLIMNDRADLCLAADFDGVHVGQDDLSPESVRKIIGWGKQENDKQENDNQENDKQGNDRWLGVSTHNPEQLRQADLTSADYVAIGPVFATASKHKPDPVVGLEGVRRARSLTRKPLVAIGGITRVNAASVIEAGADSVAVISDLLRDPRKSAEEFLRILR